MGSRRNPNSHANAGLRDAVDVTRFWGNVEKRGPDECWHWTGYLDDDGYGVFQWQGKRVGAHALALSFTTGEVRGDGLDTCHSCDNPPCCNPRHLRFDTRASNVEEMVDRGRAATPGAMLTTEQVVSIRERRANGARQKDLAEQFGVSDGLISVVVRGLRWRNVGGPIETKQSQYRKVS